MSQDAYSAEEKKTLLSLARLTIESVLKRQKPPSTAEMPEHLREILSCFVTLHIGETGELRGCVGHIGGFEPLCDNILHNAFNAAFRDNRFFPLGSLQELASCEIEISVLTAPEDIKTYSDFIIGEHGIILQKGGCSAVFLPQVAPEQGWDRETTLSHLAMKAGLDADAWKSEDAEFKIFRAIVFSESGLGLK